MAAAAGVGAVGAAEAAGLSSAEVAGTQLALDLTRWILDSFKTTPEMDRPDYLKNATITPLENWTKVNDGVYKLSYGSNFICGPKNGKGLTIDPHNGGRFHIRTVDNVYSSIWIDGKYVFAGDQATVKKGKDKVKEWERFEVKCAEVLGHLMCTIKCKRDGEYWYVDNEGIVRHRLRKEDGFHCQVFLLQKC